MNEEVIHLTGGFNGAQEEGNDRVPQENKDNREKNRRSGKVTWLIAILIAVLGLLAVGIIPRLRQQAELTVAAKENENTTPNVTVFSPHKPPATIDLVLPGTTQAIQETVISART